MALLIACRGCANMILFAYVTTAVKEEPVAGRPSFFVPWLIDRGNKLPIKSNRTLFLRTSWHCSLGVATHKGIFPRGRLCCNTALEFYPPSTPAMISNVRSPTPRLIFSVRFTLFQSSLRVVFNGEKRHES